MPIDVLIDRLTTGLAPVRPRDVRREGLILAAVCLAELVLFLQMSGMRPDMGHGMQQPSFWWRLGCLGLIALVAGTAALLSFAPEKSATRPLAWLLGLVVVSLVAGWLVGLGSGPGSHATTLTARLDWRQGLRCAYRMVLLAVPPLVALGLLMRRGAATERAATSWSVGIASAAWGAFVFVFACPSDDPLYIAVWYSVGCGLVCVITRLLLPRLTRW